MSDAAQHTSDDPWLLDPTATPPWTELESDEDELNTVDGTTIVLFPGDTGTLTHPQRLVLHALVKYRFITRTRAHNSDSSRARTIDEKAWRVLLDSEALLRERLHDLFLDLHLDRVRGVAYKRPVTTEAGGRFPTLLHDVAWNREQTALLVYLRSYLRRHQGDEASDTVIVDVDLMQEHVAGLRPADDTNISGGERRTAAAIEHLVTAGVLVKTADTARFAVDPVLEALLPLPTLQALLEHLRGTDTPNPAAIPAAESDAPATDSDAEEPSA